MDGYHLTHRQISYLILKNRTFHYNVPVLLNFIITVVLTFYKILILSYQPEEDPTGGVWGGGGGEALQVRIFNAFYV